MTSQKLARAGLFAFAGWILPGTGHLWQGRVWRGLLLGGSVVLMFAVGVGLGGHLYGMGDTGSGLLSYVFALCDLGAGLLYFGARAAGIAMKEQANLATAEYGNVFLMVAGLLNYLLALDAYDIGARRKP